MKKLTVLNDVLLILSVVCLGVMFVLFVAHSPVWAAAAVCVIFVALCLIRLAIIMTLSQEEKKRNEERLRRLEEEVAALKKDSEAGRSDECDWFSSTL